MKRFARPLLFLYALSIAPCGLDGAEPATKPDEVDTTDVELLDSAWATFLNYRFLFEEGTVIKLSVRHINSVSGGLAIRRSSKGTFTKFQPRIVYYKDGSGAFTLKCTPVSKKESATIQELWDLCTTDWEKEKTTRASIDGTRVTIEMATARSSRVDEVQLWTDDDDPKHKNSKVARLARLLQTMSGEMKIKWYESSDSGEIVPLKFPGDQ